ncbi:MAG: hypothetical protein TEF_13230 [Rhizobiales bacterium NRL2]|jgi:hypothetical protein|nr:MAG: hypothetical protein TEF_13230 [Rhizobiales bacterium NRL2]
MKIDTQSLKSAQPVNRTRRREQRADGGTFAVGESPQAGAPAMLTGLGGPSALGAVLLAQEDDTPERRRRQEIRRADDLLDRLDEIRISLLSGSLTRRTLENLASALSARRSDSDDPGLKETLDAIDLRVAVELAKYHN